MTLEQRLDLRRDDVVAARAVVEDAELVLQFLRTVDRDRDPDALFREELDDLGPQQRRVGRQAEVHGLAELGAALSGVGDGLDEHGEVEQRLAAEERDVRDLVGARFLEHEVDALSRDLLAHELRLPAVLRVDDLVLAVLVAVRAGKVALIGDVQHHRRQRERRERDHFRRGRHGDIHFADRLDPQQLVERGVEVDLGHRRLQLLARARALAHGAQHGVGRRVEREDRRARHEVDERLAGRFEPMMFSRCPDAHFDGPPSNHAM